MPRLLNSTVLALAATLVLVGCAAAKPAGSPEPTGAAATGTSVAGTGYSFNAPEGWDKPEGTPTPAGIDTFVADLNDTDGFSDNLNVLLSPAGQVSPDVVESQGVKELENAGATKVKTGDRVTIAGSESAHLSAGFTSGGIEYQIEQFYASRDKQTFVVTFSFSPTVSEADRSALYNSVLTTWSWS